MLSTILLTKENLQKNPDRINKRHNIIIILIIVCSILWNNTSYSQPSIPPKAPSALCNNVEYSRPTLNGEPTAEFLCKRGVELFEIGKDTMAVLYLQEALQKEPSSDFLYQQGLELFNIKKDTMAILYFQMAASTKANFVEPYYYMSLSYLRQNELQSAKSSIMTAQMFIKNSSNNELSDKISTLYAEIEGKIKTEKEAMEEEIVKKVREEESYCQLSLHKVPSEKEKKEFWKKIEQDLKNKKKEEREEEKKREKPKDYEPFTFEDRLLKCTFRPLNFKIARTHGVPIPEGVLVTEIYPQFLKDEDMFLKEGDIVTEIDGKILVDIIDLQKTIRTVNLNNFLPSFKIIRQKEEKVINMPENLRLYLCALSELVNGNYDAACSIFIDIGKKTGKYSQSAKVYYIVWQLNCLRKKFDELSFQQNIKDKTDFSETLSLLKEKTSSSYILRPFRDTLQGFQSFINGLENFSGSPTYIDYLKFAEDIKSFSEQVDIWTCDLKNIKGEICSLCDSTCQPVKDREMLLESQSQYLNSLYIFLDLINQWNLLSPNFEISEKIELFQDEISTLMKELPFLKPAFGFKNVCLIEKTGLQSWIKTNVQKVAFDTNNFPTKDMLLQYAENLKKASFSIKESEQWKQLEKTVEDINIPFHQISLSADIRSVNTLFKRANALVGVRNEEGEIVGGEKIKPNSYASDQEKRSYKAVVVTNELLQSKVQDAFSLILDVVIKTPYESLNKVSNTLYLSNSEIEDLACQLEKLRIKILELPIVKNSTI